VTILTISDAAKKQKRDSTPETLSDSQPPPSPQKYVYYQFIDESASIMSPTWNFEVNTPCPSADCPSPIPSFNLLLKAAEEEELKHTPDTSPLTPPQSPPETTLDHKGIYLFDPSDTSRQTSPKFIAIHS
jgi:hypothetical protein